MTVSSSTDAAPLHTDADVLRRVRELVGPATADHQLWVILIDGAGRQLPTVLPVSGLPHRPELRLLRGLERLLGGLRSDVVTAEGPGSVVFALERRGTDAVRPLDREWSDALRLACGHAGVVPGGVYLSSDGGVRRLPDAGD